MIHLIISYPLVCRNLRIREDIAKYLLNLDVNSAYYDPKTRSMREDPLPDADPNEKFYLVSACLFKIMLNAYCMPLK